MEGIPQCGLTIVGRIVKFGGIKSCAVNLVVINISDCDRACCQSLYRESSSHTDSLHRMTIVLNYNKVVISLVPCQNDQLTKQDYCGNLFLYSLNGSMIMANSSPPIAAYMHQCIRSALIQIMACCLFGAKPLSKPMRVIVYWSLRNKL